MRHADISGATIRGAVLTCVRGLFGKNRAITRDSPIDEWEAQNAIYHCRFDVAPWDFLRVIGSLRLFGVSYFTIVVVTLYAALARWYNPIAANARVSATAEEHASSGGVSPWAFVLARLPDLPTPDHLARQLVATVVLAGAATIYAAVCPSEVKEASEVRWTRAMGQPLWEYRSANWCRWWLRYPCFVCFVVGGGYSLAYLAMRAMTALAYLFTV